jgi:hypothetical protein
MTKMRELKGRPKGTLKIIDIILHLLPYTAN